VNAAAPRAVFLDRDGVLNEAIVRDGKPFPPQTLEEFALVPGVRPAIDKLKQAGFLVIVVTNQPDVARGKQSREVVDHMHHRLNEELKVDEIFVCWHDDTENCDCRKPKPGLVHHAAARYGIDLAASYLIGDRWRDIDAGHAAGCSTLLIDYGYRERAPISEPVARVHSTQDAVDWILAHERSNDSETN
jgi:D-glycero-D-manno-heptose 1,7-bisphosphate phosphatase